jgi:serine/threonine protein kinase
MKPESQFNQINSLSASPSRELKPTEGVIVEKFESLHSQTLPIENKGKIRKSYKIGHVIADSSLGQIRKCLHIRTGQIRAVKFIPKHQVESSEKLKTKLLEELDLLSQLDHPNIVKCYECFQDSKRYYIIIE